ncbi:MAG: hypothetical protein U0X86_000958 [Wolbachia endosymbiont of Xenopsylla cheopis]
MFSCFTKCCTKRKNSTINHPEKKISDGTMQNILSVMAEPPNYGVVSKLFSDIRRVEALTKPINNDCTQNVSSV